MHNLILESEEKFDSTELALAAGNECKEKMYKDWCYYVSYVEVVDDNTFVGTDSIVLNKQKIKDALKTIYTNLPNNLTIAELEELRGRTNSFMLVYIERSKLYIERSKLIDEIDRMIGYS